VAKTTERLSSLKLANLKAPGLFADGGNLYFRVAPGGARVVPLRRATFN
jgi:hypothetical protein